MPIIVDTNCFANVFSRKSAKHKDFEPVLRWIVEGKGLIIYGGKKYKQELAKASKYLTLFRLLKEVGKAVNKSDEKIDLFTAKLELIKDSELFNDCHLLAISCISKCRLICSEDTSSIPFVTDSKYIPKGTSKPIYYTSKKNSDLLDDKFVDSSLKPLCKIKNALLKKFTKTYPMHKL